MSIVVASCWCNSKGVRRALRDARALGGAAAGFLLGSRRFVCDVAAFPVGSVLTIRVQLEMSDGDGLSLFACTLDQDGAEVARATVSVYAPTDARAFLEGPLT